MSENMRDEFEEVYARTNPGDKCTRMPNGNYSGHIKQKRWEEFKVYWASRESVNVELTEAEQQEFMEFVSRWSVHCHFDGQKLIVPAGQGHSVGLAVRTAFCAWKYQIKKNRPAGE